MIDIELLRFKRASNNKFIFQLVNIFDLNFNIIIEN